MEITKDSSEYNPSFLYPKTNQKTDLPTLGYGNGITSTLKTGGYGTGQTVAYGPTIGGTNLTLVRPTTPKIGTSQQVINTTSGTQIFKTKNSTLNVGNVSGSRINSRILYEQQGGVIVHEHPSRPSRSPSPMSLNPQSNVIIPHTNFIYNSPSSPQPPPRVVSYSPAKSPPIVSTVVQSIPAPIPPPLNVNAGMVPRAQYERCVSECKTWQQKYNQLYNILLKTNNDTRNRSSSQNISIANINSQEYDYMVKQNKRLKQRVRELQQNQQRLVANMDDIITSLVNKYRDSTLKECMLLTDRYRLEKKMYQRM